MLVLLVCSLGSAVSGCTQIAVLGKVLVGDPKIDAAFKQMTGKSLEDGARVALLVTAPDSLLSEDDAVSIDVQEELERLLSRRGMDMINGDDVISVLNRQGGEFDAQLIAEEIEADYILHIDIEYFTHKVPNSPGLYHGRSGGIVYGYEVTSEEESTLGVNARKVFEKSFQNKYPGEHPVPMDRTPKRVFRNRFIDSLSSQLGRMFYDFRTQEAF